MRLTYVSDTTYWREAGGWHTSIPWPVDLMANRLGASRIEFVGRIVDGGAGAPLRRVTESGCEVAVSGVPVRGHGPSSYMKSVLAVRRSVDAAVTRADVVYVKPGVFTLLAERSLRRAPFMIYHQVGELTAGVSSIYPNYRWLGPLLEHNARRLRRTADIVAFVSEALAQKYADGRSDTLIINESRVCAADVQVSRSPASGNPPTIIYVGRLSREKGVHLLPELCKRLPYRFVIVGNGSEGERLRNAFRSNGCDERVDMIGHVPWGPDLLRLMASSDVLVLPSLTEGLGLVLVEAMSQGTPCVASAVGGIGEIVHHGQTGLLVDSRDPAVWAAAVEEAVSNSHFRSVAVRRTLDVARANTIENQLGSLLTTVRGRIDGAATSG